MKFKRTLFTPLFTEITLGFGRSLYFRRMGLTIAEDEGEVEDCCCFSREHPTEVRTPNEVEGDDRKGAKVAGGWLRRSWSTAIYLMNEYISINWTFTLHHTWKIIQNVDRLIIPYWLDSSWRTSPKRAQHMMVAQLEWASHDEVSIRPKDMICRHGNAWQDSPSVPIEDPSSCGLCRRSTKKQNLVKKKIYNPLRFVSHN